MSQSDEFQRAATEGAQQGRLELLEQRLVEKEGSLDEKIASLNEKNSQLNNLLTHLTPNAVENNNNSETETNNNNNLNNNLNAIGKESLKPKYKESFQAVTDGDELKKNLFVLHERLNVLKLIL